MWVFFGALLGISLYEAQKLFFFEHTSVYIVGALLWVAAYFYPTPEDLIFVVAVVYASVLAYTKEVNKNFLILLLYPTTSFLFLFSLYVQFGMPSLLWLLVVVASADVGAYYVGRSIGKTKFCETSPNKTIEGVFGGIVLAAILGPLFAIDSVSYWTALLISLIVAAASVFGDLFESYLKREANVKDSGDILPGHGGILDRTDGFLFAGIVMVILLKAIA
jgi:phosphatidate cytidylyltransferase